MSANADSVQRTLFELTSKFSEELMKCVSKSCASFLEDVECYLQSFNARNKPTIIQEVAAKSKRIGDSTNSITDGSKRQQENPGKASEIQKEFKVTDVDTLCYFTSISETNAPGSKDTVTNQHKNIVYQTLSEKIRIFGEKLTKHVQELCDNFLKGVQHYLYTVQIEKTIAIAQSLQLDQVSFSDILQIAIGRNVKHLLTSSAIQGIQNSYHLFKCKRQETIERLSELNGTVQPILANLKKFRARTYHTTAQLSKIMNTEIEDKKERIQASRNAINLFRNLRDTYLDIRNSMVSFQPLFKQHSETRQTLQDDLDLFLYERGTWLLV